MTDRRRYQFLLTDLIDALTIDQIKEVLLPEAKRMIYVEEMRRLEHDIDLLIAEREIKLTGRFVRLIVFLAQANLLVWRDKDRLQSEPERYYERLELAQELNGLRNQVRNLLMEELGEGKPCNRRATFLDYDGERWYSPIIDGMKKDEEAP